MVLPLVVAPHPELAPWLHHILVMGVNACLTRLPSALSPSLLLFTRGRSHLRQVDGSFVPVPQACLSGPYLQAREYLAEPDSIFIAVIFRPGFMAEALGPGVGELRDRLIPLDEVLPPMLVANLLETVAGSSDPLAWVEATQQLLRRCLRPRRELGRAADLLQATNHLFHPARRIASCMGIGLRQLERRIEHGYGTNLRELRRVVRFGFSLAHFNVAVPPRRGELTHIAQSFGYYDQAHMDRDYRDLAGMPPGEMLRLAAGDESGYWPFRFGRRDFRKLFLPEDVDSVQARLFGAP
jgi:AraC-like DNA-binding protein